MAEYLFVSKRAIVREAVVYIFCVFFYGERDGELYDILNPKYRNLNCLTVSD